MRRASYMWLSLAVALTACSGCRHAGSARSAISTWSDGKARFSLGVQGGRKGEPFVATISISNLTDHALSFPTPLVMPLAGDTNKNNIRVYDKSGRLLDMTGIHADFVRPPTIEIAPHSTRSREFRLDDYFPDLKKPGEYEIELWYFSNEWDPATWKGRVHARPLFVER